MVTQLGMGLSVGLSHSKTRQLTIRASNLLHLQCPLASGPLLPSGALVQAASSFLSAVVAELVDAQR